MRMDKKINVNDPDYDDPIVAEIRQIRNEFSERFNGDIDAMSRYFEEQRRLHPIDGIIETVPHRIHGGPAKPEARTRQERLHANAPDQREQSGSKRPSPRRAPVDQ